jgi:23S rRNA (adenine2030-N6)-methyltransferase
VNYRHAFHAGNFADVFKHVLLTRMLVYLMRKDAALRFIDTHAGIGLYDLAGGEAQRTGEWRDGIGRIDLQTMPNDIRDLMQPWLEATGLTNGAPVFYPGSPLIAQRLLRRQDRLVACELHPLDAQTLRDNVGRDKRMKVIEIDGYVGLNAFIPPPEKRGLVLIDPPFESRDEFDRLGRALVQAQAKWPGGIYAAWYPVKDQSARRFAAHLLSAGVTRVLRLELAVDHVAEDRPLAATGLVVLNPPFVLMDEAKRLLPYLAQVLARGPGAASIVEALDAL